MYLLARHTVSSPPQANATAYPSHQEASIQGQQGRSQNAENVTHIKGRLLEQAVILFNCAPFRNGNFS